MKCRKHPNYKAVKVPRVDCDACWKLFQDKHGKTVAVEQYLRFHRRNAKRA